MPAIALIIDNDGGMRQIIERILAPHGYTVIHAEDGVQGLEKFQRNEPGVVLLDIRLSDIDAPEMLEKLHKARPNVPVVLMSGLAEAETAQELVKKGGAGFGAAANISKPFKVEALVSLLDGIVGGRKPGLAQPSTAAAKAKEEPRKAPIAAKRMPAASGPAAGKKSKVIMLSSATLAVILVAGLVSYFYFFPQGPKQFRIISDSPSAMYVNGGCAYIADWMAEAVYKYDLKNFTVQDKYRISGMQASGLAFDGKYYWAAHSLEGNIHKFALEPKPAELSVFVSTGPNPSGIYFDGKNLWVADSQTNKVYKYLTDDKFTLVNTFESPARAPRVIFGAKGHLYIVEGATNRIYLVRATDFMVEGVYVLPGFETAKRRLITAYLDGKYIWACCDSEANVWRFSLKDLHSEKM